MKVKVTILIALFLCAGLNLMNSCKPKQVVAAAVYDYEAKSGGNIGAEGTTMVEITGKAKKVEDAIDQAKKNAVHAIIFRGIAGTNMAKPILGTNAETENVDYFNKFFTTGGKYLQFLTTSGDGVKDRVKTSDGYKVVMTISVKHAALRKQLEDDGIARKLDQGF